MDNSRNLEQSEQISFFGAVSLGLKVLFSELYWQTLRGLRLWEIRQMQSRLSREYEKLGRLLEDQDREEMDPDIDLCRKQIDFLSKEVEFLQSQLQKLRQDLISRRIQKWGLEKEG